MYDILMNTMRGARKLAYQQADRFDNNEYGKKIDEEQYEKDSGEINFKILTSVLNYNNFTCSTVSKIGDDFVLNDFVYLSFFDFFAV